IALLRVINTPTRGIGKSGMDELYSVASKTGGSLWDGVKAIADGAGNLTPRARKAIVGFRNIIDKLRAKEEAFAKTDKPVSDVVIAAIDDSGYSLMLRTEN